MANSILESFQDHWRDFDESLLRQLGLESRPSFNIFPNIGIPIIKINIIPDIGISIIKIR